MSHHFSIQQASCPSDRAVDGWKSYKSGPGFPSENKFDTLMVVNDEKQLLLEQSVTPILAYTVPLSNNWCMEKKTCASKQGVMSGPENIPEWLHICCMFLSGKLQLDSGRSRNSFPPVFLSSGHHPYSFYLCSSTPLLFLAHTSPTDKCNKNKKARNDQGNLKILSQRG